MEDMISGMVVSSFDVFVITIVLVVFGINLINSVLSEMEDMYLELGSSRF